MKTDVNVLPCTTLKLNTILLEITADNTILIKIMKKPVYQFPGNAFNSMVGWVQT